MLLPKQWKSISVAFSLMEYDMGGIYIVLAQIRGCVKHFSVCLFIGIVILINSSLAFSYTGYALSYSETDEIVDFLVDSKIHILHWHGPFSAYAGLPKFATLDSEKKKCYKLIDTLKRRSAIDVLFYVGPVFLLGGKEPSTGLYSFYKNQWGFYSDDYLGGKPIDGPELWAQRDSAGKIIPYSWNGENGHYLCINNKYVRQYNKGCIKLIVESRGDGVFYDGPYFANRGKCYCDSCKAKKNTFIKEMKQEYGGSTNFDYETYFYNNSIVDFFAEMKNYASTIKPGFKIAANFSLWTDDPSEGFEKSGQDLFRWVDALDIIFVESKYGTGPIFKNGAIFSSSTLYKYFSSFGDDRDKIFLDKTIPKTVLHPANYVKLSIAEAYSNGGSWVLHKPGKDFDASMQLASKEYNNFISRCESSGHPSTPWSRVLVVSSLSQGYYGQKSYFMSLCKYLVDNEVNCVMRDEAKISKEILENIDVLILPNLPYVSLSTRKLIVDFFKVQKKSIVILGRVGDINLTGNSTTSLWSGLGLKQIDYSSVVKIDADTNHGKIAYNPLPHGGLPMNDDPLSVTLASSLQKLKENVIWMLGGNSDISMGKFQDSTEAVASWDNGATKFIVNFLNYDVDGGGELTNIPVTVVLPRGLACNGMNFMSPDYGDDGNTIDFSSSKVGGNTLVTFTLPKLKIYSKMVLSVSENNLTPPTLQLR